MKIAVLMAGRISDFEKCYESHYTHIFQNNEVDLYLAHNANNTDDTIEEFKNKYPVKGFVSLNVDIRDYEKYPIPSNMGVKGRNCVVMFTCIYEAFKMIPSSVYDIVLYMRADELIYSNLKIETPLQNTVYIPSGNDAAGTNDQFAYGDYDSMKKYCSTIEHLHMFLSTNKTIFHPENINRCNLHHNNLDIVRFPLDYIIFRLIPKHNEKSNISLLKIINKNKKPI